MFLNNYLISICQPGSCREVPVFSTTFSTAALLSPISTTLNQWQSQLWKTEASTNFPYITELIMQWTLLDELIRNLSLDCWQQRFENRGTPGMLVSPIKTSHPTNIFLIDLTPSDRCNRNRLLWTRHALWQSQRWLTELGLSIKRASPHI